MKSFADAIRGLFFAVADEAHMKFHMMTALVVIALAGYVGVTVNEWLAILLSIALVITAEMINTSIEGIVDLVSPAQQPLAGKIKDIAAGAVLVAAIVAAVVGIIVFWKYFF